MPHQITTDAHEWINKIPTVPIYHLANQQSRERTCKNKRGKKTLLSLNLVSFGGNKYVMCNREEVKYRKQGREFDWGGTSIR